MPKIFHFFSLLGILSKRHSRVLENLRVAVECDIPQTVDAVNTNVSQFIVQWDEQYRPFSFTPLRLMNRFVVLNLLNRYG